MTYSFGWPSGAGAAAGERPADRARRERVRAGEEWFERARAGLAERGVEDRARPPWSRRSRRSASATSSPEARSASS